MRPPPRATMFSISMRRRGARRSFRCSAARSRPTGAWRKLRSKSLRPISRRRAPSHGPPRRRCRAATWRAAISANSCALFMAEYPWLGAATAARLARAYGTRAKVILGNARSVDDLGTCFGAGFYQAEIDYLIDKEFALTAEDILWRRSKRGLHLSPTECAQVKAYVDARAAAK